MMALHLQWTRFKRDCLAGRSRAEIAALKDVFYCGAAAATDQILKNIPVKNATAIGLKTPTAAERRIDTLVKELRDHHKLIAARQRK